MKTCRTMRLELDNSALQYHLSELKLQQECIKLICLLYKHNTHTVAYKTLITTGFVDFVKCKQVNTSPV